MHVREYQKGDIYRLFLNGIDQYQMKFMREDVLIENVAFTGVDGPIIIGCAGLALMWEGVYEAWVALDEGTKDEYRFEILKVLKRSLETMPPNVTRIHAHVNVNTQNQDHFMKFLGFEKEAVLKKYFPKGSDCVVWRKLYQCLS